jgi:protein-tyrosine phosphatase
VEEGAYSVLMVCMGNVCRSPTAEGVLRQMVAEAGLENHVRIDSAGTMDWRAGSPPDERSCHHAMQRGYDISALRARQVDAQDFEEFDLILAMDWRNLDELRDLCPANHQSKLRRLMEFAPRGTSEVVEDPYYGVPEDFERVLDHIEHACRGLVAHLRQSLGQPG